METNSIDEGALKLIENGENRLAILSGLAPRRFAGADIAAMRRSSGLIVHPDGGTTSWSMEGLREIGGKIAAVGPWIDETRSLETALTDSPPSGAGLLLRLIPAVRAILRVGDPVGGLYTRGIRLLPDGGVFVVPPRFAAFVREGQIRPAARSTWDPWNHPDLGGEEAWSFALGSLAWFLLTGTEPFPGSEEEERHERIRSRSLPQPDIAVPGLKSDLAEIISRALIGGESGRPLLGEWEKALRMWSRDGALRDLDDSERAEAEERAARERTRGEKGFHRRRTLRRRRVAIIGGIFAAAALFSGVYGPVKKSLEPPLTVGMSPTELIAAYYRGIDELDTEIVEDCLAKEAPRMDLNQVTHMFVTSRVREGYEGSSGLIPADEWIAQGRPSLEIGQWPWGIVAPTVTPLGNNLYRVRYERWGPSNTESDNRPLGLATVDIVRVVEGKKSWEIEEITREEVPIILSSSTR